MSLSSLFNLSSNADVGANSATSRPLVLSHAPTSCRIQFAVPEQHWIAAEILRDRFVRHLDDDQDAKIALAADEHSGDDENESSANQADAQRAQLKAQRQIILLSLFLGLASRSTSTSANKNARAKDNLAVLHAAFSSLVETHLAPSGLDIHALAFKHDTEQRRIVIRNFYEARTVLESAGYINLPSGPSSKLFSTVEKGAEPTIQAIFGGQGTNEVYFDELQVCSSRDIILDSAEEFWQSLYALYAPLLSSLLSKANDLFSSLATKHKDTLLYSHSLHPLSWLLNPSTRPPVTYLASCAVSMPLIGLTQLAHYVVVARALSLSPDEFRAKFAGATGHSQGVVTACIIARDNKGQGWEEFFVNSLNGLRLLFYIGLRGSVVL